MALVNACGRQTVLFILVILLSGLQEIVFGQDVETIREGCKAVLSCKTDQTMEPMKWNKLGGNLEPLNSSKVTEFVVNGILHNTVTLDSVNYSDRGLYACNIDGTQIRAITLIVLKGIMVLKSNTSSEDLTEGTIKYFVETCLPDVFVQFFRGPDLLESTTEPMEKGYLGKLQLVPDEIHSGEYAIQAISERANMVETVRFTV